MSAQKLLKGLRLVTFERASGCRCVGALLGNEVVDLAAAELPADMKSFLEAGKQAYEQAKQVVLSGKHRIPLQDVRLRAPIYDPQKIICVGLNYKDHAQESGMPIPAEPVLFSKYPSAIVGPNDAVVKPAQTEELDYEVELVIVVGKRARNVQESEAYEYVSGYTVGHDVSARDWQLRKPGGQWMVGKTFDTFAPIGPYIQTVVPAQRAISEQETFEPHNLKIRCLLNGEIMQDSNTNQLAFQTCQLISYISKIMTLYPGDLIFTGTPSGVGFARTPPVFLKPGDEVCCEIEELGSLINKVK